MRFPFVGAAYTLPTARANAQSSINLYLETDESGTGKSPAQLVGRPGLTLFTTLPPSPIRGIWIGEARMFVVAGASVYEVFSNGTYTSHGTVANDGNPAQIFPNGNQIAIVSGGFLYYDNGDGAGVQQPTFPGFSGTAVGGIAGATNLVFWLSGDKFDSTMMGRVLTLNATNLGTVAQVLNDQTLQLTT